MTEREKEWAAKASKYLKIELKRAGVTYAELARRLNEHGLEETDSITSKLGRGTFSATFLFACLAVLGIAAVPLADL